MELDANEVKLQGISNAHVTLHLDEVESERLPSRSFSVQVRLGDLSAKTHVWVEQDVIDAFVRGLTELERTRQGTASLEAMSPGELTLTIAGRGGAGGIDVEVSLLRHLPVLFQVSGRFELDPGWLSSVLTAFRRVASAEGPL